jgi:hypothetical protein
MGLAQDPEGTGLVDLMAMTPLKVTFEAERVELEHILGISTVPNSRLRSYKHLFARISRRAEAGRTLDRRESM